MRFSVNLYSQPSPTPSCHFPQSDKLSFTSSNGGNRGLPDMSVKPVVISNALSKHSSKEVLTAFPTMQLETSRFTTVIMYKEISECEQTNHKRTEN